MDGFTEEGAVARGWTSISVVPAIIVDDIMSGLAIGVEATAMVGVTVVVNVFGEFIDAVRGRFADLTLREFSAKTVLKAGAAPTKALDPANEDEVAILEVADAFT